MLMKNSKMNALNIEKYERHSYYLCFLVICFLVNVGVKRQTGDDVVHLEELWSAGNIFVLLKNRYIGWTGRIFIEFFMYLLLDQNIIIWKIINSFMILFLAIGIYKLVLTGSSCGKYNNYLFVVTAISIFTLPLDVLSTSVTWITGSFNYLWPVAGGVICLYCTKAILCKQQVTKLHIGLTIFCSIFACNQEQVAAILIGFNLFAIVFCFVRDKTLDYRLLLILGAVILFGGFSILAPGNRSRYFAEINTWYPGFGELSCVYKLWQSLSFSLDRFVNMFSYSNRQFNLLMMSISLMICVLCRNKRVISKISILPIIYFLIRCFFHPSFGYLIFDYDLKHIVTVNGIFSFVLCAVIFVIMTVCLYHCFEDIESKWISSVLFLGAILSGLVVGFSPTIFASGSRIFFCSFVLFVIVFGMLFSLILHKFRENIWFKLGSLFYFAYLSLTILLYIVKWSGILLIGS